MAGLVSYDGSGSSEDEDEQSPGGNSASAVNFAGSTNSNPKLGPAKAKSSVMFSRFMDDEDEEIQAPASAAAANSRGEEDDSFTGHNLPTNEANPVWSKFLPQPKKPSTVKDQEFEDPEEIGPIPPKKTYGDEELVPPKPSMIPSLTAKKVAGKVRISIPFLNSLDELEPEEDTNKRKYLEPSKKGSGLFAILPQPKNSFAGASSATSFLTSKTQTKSGEEKSESKSTVESSQDNNQPRSVSSMGRLIPDAVKNRLKRPAPGKLDEIRAKFSKKIPAEGVKSSIQKDSDDSDDEQGDFFSLDSTDTIDPEALERLKLPMPDFQRNQQTTPTESMEVDEEQEEHQPQPSSSRQEDLMKFIRPKKGRKDEVQIIDINADDLRPDNTEWLRNITDESAVPARRGKGMGGMTKRKHQITYLAFEAKAREQELKNQWAQNRANKMATKNKYGF